MSPSEHIKRLLSLKKAMSDEVNTIHREGHTKDGCAVWSAINDIDIGLAALETALKNQEYIKK